MSDTPPTDYDAKIDEVIQFLDKSIRADENDDYNSWIPSEAKAQARHALQQLLTEARIEELRNLHYIETDNSRAEIYSYKYGDPPMTTGDRIDMLSKKLIQLRTTAAHKKEESK